MSSLDAVGVTVVLLAAAGGAYLGALSQLAQLGAVAVGWAGARLLGPALAPFLRGVLPAFAAHPVASLAAFVGCAVAARLALRLLTGLLGLTRARGGGPDRGLGALLGGAQAAVIVWVALSALVTWARPIHLGPLDLDPAGSDLCGFAREHNALGTVAPFGRHAESP